MRNDSDMIKVAYLIPCLNYGETEEVVLNMCKFTDRTRFQTIVASMRDGPIREEMEAAGAMVFVEKSWDRMLRYLKKADIINLYWANGYERRVYNLIRSLRKPFLMTLQWYSILPDLPEITICPSRTIYEIQRYKSNLVVIPNGIDLDKFTPKQKEEKKKVILTRICRPEKCDHYFWYAMYEVLARRPNAELWIVGEEGESRGRVKFLGIRRDIPEILWQTDIFVYTPRPRKGANDLVVMEAMACGVPPVVSDVECVRESITHMKDGILVPFGKVSEFADAVIELIDDVTLRRELGWNATRKALEHFDARKMAKEYEKLYLKVLADAGRGSEKGTKVKGDKEMNKNEVSEDADHKSS